MELFPIYYIINFLSSLLCFNMNLYMLEYIYPFLPFTAILCWKTSIFGPIFKALVTMKSIIFPQSIYQQDKPEQAILRQKKMFLIMQQQSLDDNSWITWKSPSAVS